MLWQTKPLTQNKMNNLTKYRLQIWALILLLLLSFGLIVKGVSSFITDIKKIDNEMGFTQDYPIKLQELEHQNSRLTDSIVYYIKEVQNQKRTVAEHQIVIENLKLRKNEKIKHIDTMSASDLYLFFTEQQ